MRADNAIPLLGGLTPARFMERHWQRKPLLVRGALGGEKVLPVARSRMLELAASDEVESRVVVRAEGDAWQMQHGPVSRRSLPARARPGWTLLVQGMDLHEPTVHEVMHRFRFVPDARLDDVMISWASDGGGVGPHFDSYDVFLLQVEGRRRWRWGRQRDLSLREDMPLKVLSRFEPEHEAVLEPGDMLYLPPHHAHDGIAEGECQTWSIGFRAPSRAELGRELLMRLAEGGEGDEAEAMYRDPRQPATDTPGEVPQPLREFARDAALHLMAQPQRIDRALGEYLTEPKPRVWFEPGGDDDIAGGVRLDARSRMMYDERHVFINGESWRASGADARLMRRLADRRRLDAQEVARAPAGARELLMSWCQAGWLHPEPVQLEKT